MKCLHGVVLLGLLLNACQSARAPVPIRPSFEDQVSLRFAAMGLIWQLEYRPEASTSFDNKAIERIFQSTLEKYESTFSDWNDESELRRIELKGYSPHQFTKTSPLFIEGLDLARTAFRLSDELFDITMGAVIWKLRERPTGMTSLEIRSDQSMFRFGANPDRLSFGGLAKGMVLGDLAQRFRAAQLRSFRIEGGGGNEIQCGSYLSPQFKWQNLDSTGALFVARSASHQGEKQHILDPRNPKRAFRLKVRVECLSQQSQDFKQMGAISDALSKALIIESSYKIPNHLNCLGERMAP